MAARDNDLRFVLETIAADNAAAQARFLQSWTMLLDGDLEAMADDRSKKRIFSVPMGQGEAFPAFQFENGQPRTVIADVLGALPATMSGWQTALWFVGSCGWLAAQRPVDRLDDQEALVVAAQHAADEWLG